MAKRTRRRGRPGSLVAGSAGAGEVHRGGAAGSEGTDPGRGGAEGHRRREAGAGAGRVGEAAAVHRLVRRPGHHQLLGLGHHGVGDGGGRRLAVRADRGDRVGVGPPGLRDRCPTLPAASQRDWFRSLGGPVPLKTFYLWHRLAPGSLAPWTEHSSQEQRPAQEARVDDPT